MRVRRSIVGIGVIATLTFTTPAQASAPAASCVGQQLSALGPAYGAELGAAVSNEAQHPEILGRTNLGGWVSTTAHADPGACPIED